MSVLGVVVVPNGKRPQLHGAVLEGTLSSPRLSDAFHLKPTALEPSEQAVELAQLLSAKLASGLTAAAIRVAGTPPVARRFKAQFSRAHCEGAVMFVLREHTGHQVGTIVPTGLAKTLGLTNDELDEIVAQLTLEKVHSDALLAGLTMLER